LKVGKKKAPANNFTDTSFSSKAIVLTGQSITQDKSSELTNTRNLTLDELLVQLKHYSATVRKDAVAGIRDLLNLHPHLLHLQLGSIVNASIRLVTDNDPSVRKDFLRFYEYILERVAETDLTPFVSMIVAFTCAGLTHILDDIRGDALRFLDQLVASFPRLLSGYSDTIMPNFFSLLATSTEATQAGGSGENTCNVCMGERARLQRAGPNIVLLFHVRGLQARKSIRSRLTILRTCYNYIKACISTDTTAERRRFWFLDTDELPKFDAGAAKNWSDPRGNSGALAQDPTP
ncbi:rRNA processing protein, partial [Spiromyces aspiralis]